MACISRFSYESDLLLNTVRGALSNPNLFPPSRKEFRVLMSSRLIFSSHSQVMNGVSKRLRYEEVVKWTEPLMGYNKFRLIIEKHSGLGSMSYLSGITNSQLNVYSVSSKGLVLLQ